MKLKKGKEKRNRSHEKRVTTSTKPHRDVTLSRRNDGRRRNDRWSDIFLRLKTGKLRTHSSYIQKERQWRRKDEPDDATKIMRSCTVDWKLTEQLDQKLDEKNGNTTTKWRLSLKKQI